MTPPINWAGNYRYRAARWHHPHSAEEVQDLVRRAKAVKVLGTRHSFNGVADTTGDLMSLARLNRIIGLDLEQQTVTLQAGVQYGELSRYLQARGRALPNLASLPALCVAGACATGSHGSGDKLAGLASSVAAVDLVTADGDLVHLSRQRQGEAFQGMVVSLGGLGVVTQLTLDVQPTYQLRQDVYRNLPWAQLEMHFDEIMASADSVSLFTDWQRDHVDQVWLKRRCDDPSGSTPEPEWFGATLARENLHPAPGQPADRTTPQMGVPGPWHERLPHFQAGATPSSGKELQSEYLLPRPQVAAALRALRALGAHLAPLLLVSEVRTVAADRLWMSPCYLRPCVALHFTWCRNEPAVRALLPLIEEQLTPLGARPHWGKVFTLIPEQLRPVYERLPEFRTLMTEYDPQGKFRNDFLDTYIFNAPN